MTAKWNLGWLKILRTKVDLIMANLGFDREGRNVFLMTRNLPGLRRH